MLAPAALEEPHQRHAPAHGEGVGVLALLEGRLAVGAALDREVVAADDDGAAVDARRPHHEVRRREGAQRTVLAELGLPRRLAVLPEAVLVAERRDALAHRAAPALALPRHRLRAAVLPGERPAALDGVDLVLPAHGRNHSPAAGSCGGAPGPDRLREMTTTDDLQAADRRPRAASRGGGGRAGHRAPEGALRRARRRALLAGKRGRAREARGGRPPHRRALHGGRRLGRRQGARRRARPRRDRGAHARAHACSSPGTTS